MPITDSQEMDYQGGDGFAAKQADSPASTGAPRRVVFVRFPQMCLLDITGPQTVFAVASKFATARGLSGYDCLTVSLDGEPVTTVEGVVMLATPARAKLTNIDTIVVPGTFEFPHLLNASLPLVDWLRDAASGARRVASVRTGAFLLAHAGLLDGKRAVTHWANSEHFAELFPAVETDRESIFVKQQNVWTSAGVTAGIDLSLALVEEDYGHEIALLVAKELVVYLKRPGNQPQLSEMLKAQTRDIPAFDTLHLWILEHMSREDLTVDLMATRTNMSPRNFARAYKEKTGRTPAKALEDMRMEAACRLLRATGRSLKDIARACGFGDEERMRVTFHRRLNMSPSDFRKLDDDAA